MARKELKLVTVEIVYYNDRICKNEVIKRTEWGYSREDVLMNVIAPIYGKRHEDWNTTLEDAILQLEQAEWYHDNVGENLKEVARCRRKVIELRKRLEERGW